MFQYIKYITITLVQPRIIINTLNYHMYFFSTRFFTIFFHRLVTFRLKIGLLVLVGYRGYVEIRL